MYVCVQVATTVPYYVCNVCSYVHAHMYVLMWVGEQMDGCGFKQHIANQLC